MKKHGLTAWVIALVAWTFCFTAYAYDDAKALGLKGRVKNIIIPIGCTLEEMPFFGVNKLTFNEDGSIAAIDGKTISQSAQWTIERDKTTGRINKIVNNDGYAVYTTQIAYNSKGHIGSITISLKGEKSDVVYTFVYNTMGHVSRFFNKSGGSSSEFHYLYGDADSHLNWLTRSYTSASGNTITQTRRITYRDDAPAPQEEITDDAFFSNDLRMKELKGHVKSVRWYNNEQEGDFSTFGFTQKGEWTTLNGKALSNTYKQVKRDSKGRIIYTYEGEYDAITAIEYTYNADGFIAANNADYGSDGYSKEVFSYNSKGELETSRIVENMGYDAPDEPAVTFTYMILERDSQNNWTRRQVKGSDGGNRVEKRVITYWDDTTAATGKASTSRAKTTSRQTNGTSPRQESGKKRNTYGSKTVSRGTSNTSTTIAPGQGDLPLLQLGGKVLSCTWTDDRGLLIPIYEASEEGTPTTCYKFSQSGRLTTIDDTPALGDGGGESYFNFHERDAKGKLHSASLQWSYYTPMSSHITWTYGTTGRLAKTLYEEQNATVTATYAYDTQGRISTTTATYKFDFSDYDAASIREMGLGKYKNTTLRITYNYLATDSHGNWTKRTATTNKGATWTETRIIKYYQ